MRLREFFLILTISLILLPLLTFGQVNWSSLGPGCGGDLLTGAIQPDNSNIMYIGGDIEGAFKTIDGGQSWSMINFGLCGGDRTASAYAIQEIVIDPNNYQTLYVCTWAGLYKSENGGDNWCCIFPEVMEEEGPAVSYIAVDPVDEYVLYVGIGNAAQESDGTGTLIRSWDGGETWEDVDIIMGESTIVHSIYIDPTSPEDNRTVYVATDNGVYKSTDDGDTWGSAINGLPHVNTRRLVGHTSGGVLTLFLSIKTEGDPSTPASWEGGLYRSVDGGANWEEINGDLPTYDADGEAFYDYRKFDVHPTNPDIMYMGTYYSDAYTDMGIYKTTNGGDNWVKVDDDNVTFGWLDDVWWEDLNVALLKIAPNDPDIVMTGKDYPQKTVNAGSSWQQMYTDDLGGGAWSSRGIELMVVMDFGFDPVDENVLYVAYDDMGLMRSDDGGISFEILDPHQDPEGWYDGANSIAVDPANGDLYVGRNNGTNDQDVEYIYGTVLKSTDQGETFTEINTGLPEGRPVIVLDPNSSQSNRRLYCAVYGQGVYRSTDSGQTWTEVNTGLGDAAVYAWTIALDPNDGSTAYLGCNSLYGMGDAGVFKTTNAGESWSRVSDDMPYMDVMSIDVNPMDSNTLYVAGTDCFEWSETGGVYKTTNGGGSWMQVLSQPRCGVVRVNPSSPDVIYVSAQSWWNYIPDMEYGIYRSMNGGTSWELINENLAHTYVMCARINPHNNNQIFVGTHGGGVWTSTNINASVQETPAISKSFALVSSYPNPFNSTTRLVYSVETTQKVVINLYNINGRFIKKVMEKTVSAGLHNAVLDTGNLPSGTYIVQLKTGSHASEKKITKLR